jgi:hypothetical protein
MNMLDLQSLSSSLIRLFPRSAHGSNCAVKANRMHLRIDARSSRRLPFAVAGALLAFVTADSAYFVHAAALQSPISIPVSVVATYLPTNQDPNAVLGTPIDLSALGLVSGDRITLSSRGAVTFCTNCSEFLDPGMLGAFTNGPKPDATNVLGVGLEIITGPTLFGNLPTDIPHDFGFSGQFPTTVTIPNGATTLWVSVADAFFSDNGGALSVAISSPTSACRPYSGPTWHQTDELWADDIYDHTKKTMVSKGCALTALAMALSQAGVKRLPNGIDLDPGELNEYLIANVSGAFNKAGNVEWPTITESVGKQQQLKFNNFRKSGAAADAFLTESLCSRKVPVVVNVPGHFVLVIGKENDPTTGSPRFSIIDPDTGRNYRFLDQYGSYETRGYVADPVDLSVFAASITGDARIMVSTPDGRTTGIRTDGTVLDELTSATSFVDRIDDDVTGERGEESQVIQVSHPTATYELTVSGQQTGTYQLMLDSFATDGARAPLVVMDDLITRGSTRIYSVRIQSDGSAVTRQVVSFDNLLDDIRAAVLVNLIKDQGIASALTTQVSNAKRQADAGNRTGAANMLSAFINFIQASPRDKVLGIVADVLARDANVVVQSLQ